MFGFPDPSYRHLSRYDPEVELCRMVAVSAELFKATGKRSAWLRIVFGKYPDFNDLDASRLKIKTALDDLSTFLALGNNNIKVVELEVSGECIEAFEKGVSELQNVADIVEGLVNKLKFKSSFECVRCHKKMRRVKKLALENNMFSLSVLIHLQYKEMTVCFDSNKVKAHLIRYFPVSISRVTFSEDSLVLFNCIYQKHPWVSKTIIVSKAPSYHHWHPQYTNFYNIYTCLL
ncbi:hypothetical protein MIR68_010409 [Amoeboaphelidium protococcarum]|nr:hypothetical protein MIR68_010409 [Amoeboaphelidium protococcarum]